MNLAKQYRDGEVGRYHSADLLVLLFSTVVTKGHHVPFGLES